MKKLSKIECLEQALCLWEDIFFLINLRNLGSVHIGKERILDGCFPVENYRKLRSDMMSGGGRDNFGVSQYMCTDDLSVAQELSENVSMPSAVPVIVAPWVQSSKRVYKVDKELQLLFEHTSLEGVVWKDLLLPFNVFAIEFDVPLVSNGNLYDFVVVHRYEVVLDEDADITRHELTFFMLSSKVLKRCSISAMQRKKLLQFRKRKQWTKLYNLTGKLLNKLAYADFFLRTFYELDEISEMGLFEIDPTVQADSDSDFDEDQEMECSCTVLRILASLILYMKALPKDSPYVMTEKYTRVSGETSLSENVVTEDADICSVLSNHSFSLEEREVLESHESRQGGWTVRPHFRTGFWRRPKGTGHIPDAPRTEWVRPTLVAGNRLPEGTVPHGSKNTLKV